MKRIAIPTVIILAAISLNLNAAKLFVDEEGRFSFSFEGDWRKLDDKEESIDGHFVLVKNGKAVAEVIITHQKPEKETTLEKFFASEVKRINSTEGYTLISKDEKIKIGGHPAAWFAANISEKDVSGRTSVRKISQYIIAKGDTFWGISAIVAYEDVNLLTMIQNTIVRSFEFSTGGTIALAPLVKTDIKVILDPNRRYSIKVPDDWKVAETEGPELAMESDIGDLHIFSLPAKDNETTAEDAADDFVLKYEILEKPHVVNDAPVKIGDEKGHIINYEGEKDGIDYHVQLFVVVRDATVFYDYFISSPRKWRDNTGLITGVQSTFSFIRKKIPVGEEYSGLPGFLQADDNESSVTGIEIEPERMITASDKLLWEPFIKDNVPR